MPRWYPDEDLELRNESSLVTARGPVVVMAAANIAESTRIRFDHDYP